MGQETTVLAPVEAVCKKDRLQLYLADGQRYDILYTDQMQMELRAFQMDSQNQYPRGKRLEASQITQGTEGYLCIRTAHGEFELHPFRTGRTAGSWFLEILGQRG